MLSFLPHILFLLSIAGILIIFGKKLPTLKNTDAGPVEEISLTSSVSSELEARARCATTTSFLHDVSISAHILANHILGSARRKKILIYLSKLLRQARALFARWESKIGSTFKSLPARSSHRVLREQFDQDSKHKISWDDIRRAEGKFFFAPPKFKTEAGTNKDRGGEDIELGSASEVSDVFAQAEAQQVREAKKFTGDASPHQSLPISPTLAESVNSEEEEFWLSVLRQNPHNPHPYKKLGEIYMRRGEYKEAAAAFEYVLKRNPYDQETAKWMDVVKRKSN